MTLLSSNIKPLEVTLLIELEFTFIESTPLKHQLKDFMLV